MRTLLFTLALFAALPAAAQNSFDGTWSAVTMRTIASAGDTTRVPAAQTLVLSTDTGGLVGSSFNILSIPENAFGDGAPAITFSSEGAVQGQHDSDRAQIMIWAIESGQTNTFDARLTHGGSRMTVTPAEGSRGVAAEYRRVPSSGQ